MLRFLKNVFGWFPLRGRARIVARLVPARYWYRTALWASRTQGRITGWMGGNRFLTEALMLDHWLQELTLCGEFPIPWRPAKIDALERAQRRTGVLYCSTHLPLLDLPFRLQCEMGFRSPWAIAEIGRIIDAGFIIPGLLSRLRTIPADQYALVKLRSVLRAGESVACMVDAELGSPLSSRTMKVAGKVGAHVIFFWAERQTDGFIDIWFIDAPRPHCESEEAIEENLEALRAINQRILGPLGVRPSHPSARSRDTAS